MKPPHEHPTDESQRLLQIGIALSLGIFALELAGGFWTHSLALVSDAWHIFIDIWALFITYLAVFLAKRPVNDRRTFGLHRMEVLAATVNGFTVFGIAIGILFAAWKRFNHPVTVDTMRLFWISLSGLVLNLVVARLFYQRSHHDLNFRGAFLHVVGDAVNTFAVILSAVAMHFTKIPRIDPIVSGLLAFVVLWGSGRLLKDSFNTLLEGVPRDIVVSDVERELVGIDGIVSVHDLHVWSICSHLNSLSGHVLLTPEHMIHQHRILEDIGRQLKERFGIVHTTVQVESKAWPRIEEELAQAQHG